MEATKRKYQKHITGGKVAIKHYLRKNKQVDEFNNLHSVYVQITIKRQTTQFRSRIRGSAGVLEEDFENQQFEIYKDAIERDIKLIEFIVKMVNPFDKVDFNVNEIAKIYNYAGVDLQYLFDNYLMWAIEETYKKFGLRVKIKPLSYIGYYQDSDLNIKEKSSKFKSKIWFLDAIIDELSEQASSSYFVLSPTIADFVNGTFENSLRKYKILNDVDLALLIEDMTNLYKTFEKELWS